MKTTIDRDGRIALDKEVQTMLGVQPGDNVLLENRGDEWILKSLKSDTGLCLEGNVLVHRGVSSRPGIEPLATLRDARLDQLTEELAK
jgi:bifunctional DNA-binding transcriptional regulator/antitoxin component of YhaV-PrlF toxin-antitoxin module